MSSTRETGPLPLPLLSGLKLRHREDVKLQIEALKTTESILPRELYANLRVPQQQIRSLDGPSTHPAAAKGGVELTEAKTLTQQSQV
jgi:hypothetical protein